MNDICDRVAYLLGNKNIEVKPLPPYSELVCEFLNELSIVLLRDRAAKKYADVVSFAFWCRRANILRLKEKFHDDFVRIGRGILFHIAPANVPINFAFSYVFGMLSGNANIVRVSDKQYPQVELIIQAMLLVLTNPKFDWIKNSTAIVRYAHDEAITAYFSSLCDVRIIWGGDRTVKEIRKCEIPVDSMEIVFADRYSFCVLRADKIMELDETELDCLARGFYNDTYLNDQDACSAPNLIVWTGQAIENAKIRFWQAVYREAKKYDLASVKVVDKYLLLCENAIEYGFTKVIRADNLIYRVTLSELPKQMDMLRGRFGLFYEYTVTDFDLLSEMINKKYQTLTYFGESKKQLLDFVVRNQLRGIDRIVPVGSAMDIGVIWDGYDLIRSLSRIIHTS